jgi:hypothetical protein
MSLKDILNVKIITPENILTGVYDELKEQSIIVNNPLPRFFDSDEIPEELIPIAIQGTIFTINGNYYFIEQMYNIVYNSIRITPNLIMKDGNFYFQPNQERRSYLPFLLYPLEKGQICGYQALQSMDQPFAISVNYSSGRRFILLKEVFEEWLNKKENRLFNVL